MIFSESTSSPVSGVHLPVLDPVASVLVDLVEADLLALAAGRIKCDGTRYERQLQIALPICARCHGRTPVIDAALIDMEAAAVRIQGGGLFAAESKVALPICSQTAA